MHYNIAHGQKTSIKLDLVRKGKKNSIMQKTKAGSQGANPTGF